jgi:hypothetical protein
MLIFPPRPQDFKFPEAKSPRLRIISYSDAARTIVVRGVTQTGVIHDTYATTADRLIQTRDISLTQIPLSVHVSTTNTNAKRGRLYVQLQLQFATDPTLTLAADYVSFNTPLTWPGGNIINPTTLQGHIISFSLPAPAVGAEWLHTVEANTLVLIRSLSYRFVTDATVATRTSDLLINNAAGVLVRTVRPNATQAASLTRNYFLTPEPIVQAAFGANIFGTHYPIHLPTSGNLTTSTTSIQAGDQYTDVVLELEQWLNP